MLLNDEEIRNSSIIRPYSYRVQNNNVISYGEGFFGYDLTLSDEFVEHYLNDNHNYIDPLDTNSIKIKYFKAPNFVIQPNQNVLGVTNETVTMPPYCLGIVKGKSTYARLGVIINTTPIEPGWQGRITLNIYNSSNKPVKLYTNQGIAQIIFLRGSIPSKLYNDVTGKYQNTHNITLPQYTVNPMQNVK